MLKKTREQLKHNVDKLAVIVHKLMPPSKNVVNQIKSSGIEVKYFCDDNYLAFAEFNFNNNQPIIAVNALKSKVDRLKLITEELGDLTAIQGWLPFDSELKPNPKYPVLDTISVHPKIKLLNRNSYKRRVYVLKEFTRIFLAPQYVRLANSFDLPMHVNSRSLKDYLN